MRAGDIVFVRGKGWISRLIRFFDKGEFTHVAIAVSATKVIEAQRFVKTRIIEIDYEDYQVVDLDLTSKQRYRSVIEAHKFLGTRYDYLQIGWHFVKSLFSLTRKYPYNNPNTLICSELVGRVLYEIGVIEEQDVLYELTPNQLYDYLQYVQKNRRPA